MSKFKEIAKKAAITVGLVAGAFAFSMVGNTVINATKSADVSKFYLEAKGDINKATQLYEDKWKGSLLSSINTKINNAQMSVFEHFMGDEAYTQVLKDNKVARDITKADGGLTELYKMAVEQDNSTIKPTTVAMDWIKNQVEKSNSQDLNKEDVVKVAQADTVQAQARKMK